jgi:hypothetical protein
MMQGQLFKTIDDNRYYIIDNVGAYNCIVVEFATFTSKFLSIEIIQNSMIEVEFNNENVKNLLDTYTIFEGSINYEFLESDNYIIYNRIHYYLRNWVDIFNFANKVI